MINLLRSIFSFQKNGSSLYEGVLGATKIRCMGCPTSPFKIKNRELLGVIVKTTGFCSTSKEFTHEQWGG
jgi:hypothetical protein